MDRTSVSFDKIIVPNELQEHVRPASRTALNCTGPLRTKTYSSVHVKRQQHTSVGEAAIVQGSRRARALDRDVC